MTTPVTTTGTEPPHPVSWTRLLGAELRWVLRRPRMLVLLGLLALVPVLMAVGIVLSDRGPSGGLVGAVAGNGLVLPVTALSVTLTLLLPMAVAVAAADAIAGEAAHGTLRGLLLAPVGRLRLAAMKGFGVLVVAAAATAVVIVAALLAGWLLIGPPDPAGAGGAGVLVTLSGSTLDAGEVAARLALVAVWTFGQLAAVAAVALAVSACTEHPLVVLASVLGGLIAFGVLGTIPALEPLQPWLLTMGWGSGADVLRDPVPYGGLGSSTALAAGYLLAGAAVLVVRMRRRDA
ncbi:ABC transporter permease subunit [Pseudonocardia nantongensis]|uniref:ABC transporter permease subunit n=1 Tax=Pseudonocardia nantongensis TaxID=1181885 RepID=UPI00397D5193